MKWKWKEKKNININIGIDVDSSTSQDQYDVSLFDNIEENISELQKIYENCADVQVRQFSLGNGSKALLIFIEGLTDENECNENVLNLLMNKQISNSIQQLEEIIKKTLAVSGVSNVKTFKDIIESISIGKPVILVDKQLSGVSLSLQRWEQRGIEEPQAERVVRGPREGFTESFQVNTAMLRRRIRSPKLKIKLQNIGRLTETTVGVSYIEGVADQDLIDEVTSRLKRIDIDGIIDSGYIEQLIEDNPYSPFPQVIYTERPDTVAAALLEGRVAIIVNNSPCVLIAPITIYSMFQASEDYYERFMIATMIRWLRYLFIVIALLLPSVYVAILTFHQEMLPTTLMMSVASSREIVPFPVLIEALVMEIIFEVLREAGIRLPVQIGSAVSIVGALIIGEAAVSAGLISAPMIIVVAMTGIASFAIPHYNTSIALRMLRFPLILLASILGLLGVILGVIVIVIHLCSLRSFGVPYLSPLAPSKQPEMKDVLIRAPLWKMNTRPRLTGNQNKYRQAPNQKPGPMQ